jgi:inhibitor of the pro-sigma K processing machinery
MDLGARIALWLLCALAALGIVRLFAAPLKLALKLLLNTLLGFAALFALHLLRGVTGFALGLNLFNALTIGILGLPGLILLALLKLVFV